MLHDLAGQRLLELGDPDAEEHGVGHRRARRGRSRPGARGRGRPRRRQRGSRRSAGRRDPRGRRPRRGGSRGAGSSCRRQVLTPPGMTSAAASRSAARTRHGNLFSRETVIQSLYIRPMPQRRSASRISWSSTSSAITVSPSAGREARSAGSRRGSAAPCPWRAAPPRPFTAPAGPPRDGRPAAEQGDQPRLEPGVEQPARRRRCAPRRPCPGRRPPRAAAGRSPSRSRAGARPCARS